MVVRREHFNASQTALAFQKTKNVTRILIVLMVQTRAMLRVVSFLFSKMFLTDKEELVLNLR